LTYNLAKPPNWNLSKKSFHNIKTQPPPALIFSTYNYRVVNKNTLFLRRFCAKKRKIFIEQLGLEYTSAYSRTAQAVRGDAHGEWLLSLISQAFIYQISALK